VPDEPDRNVKLYQAALEDISYAVQVTSKKRPRLERGYVEAIEGCIRTGANAGFINTNTDVQIDWWIA